MADSSTFSGFKRVVGSTTSKLKVVSGNGAGVATQDRVYFGSATLQQEGANPAALLMGYGNSTTRVQSNVANDKFISFYTEGNADGQYGAYFRHYVSTEALSNDCLRAFATVNNVAAATVRGAHISLSFGTTGTVTGLGAALECTLHIPNQATQNGTLTALKLAINSDGSTSDPAGAQLSYIRIENQGDDTGEADVDDDVYLFDIVGHTIGDNNLVEVAADETSYAHNIRIRVGATIMYLMCADDRA